MEALVGLSQAWWPLYGVHLLEVSLFIALVWAVDRWVRLDAGLRYGLWLLALVKMFVPPFYAVSLPAFWSAGAIDEVSMVASGEVVGAETVVMPVAEMDASVSPVVYAFCLWAMSVLIFAGVALWRNARFLRSLSGARRMDLPGEVEELEGVADLQVFSKGDLHSPLLAGLLKPRLYLPSHWTTWTPEQLRGVVAHELAHYRRRDVWALVFQVLATVLFGLNPLVWVVNRRLSLLRELRCDEAALRNSGVSPVVYGRLLYDFLEGRERPALMATHFTEQGTSLRKRLEHVLNFKEGNMKRSRWQWAVPALVGLMIMPFSIREMQAQGASRVYQFYEVEEKPEVVYTHSPVYPAEAKEKGLSGRVLLKIRVNEDGSVSNVEVMGGEAVFHQAAVDAVQKFRFKPAQHEGRPVAVWLSLPFAFQLDATSPGVDTKTSNDTEQGMPRMIHKASISVVWINAQGALLLDMEKEIPMGNLAQELTRLKHEKGTQRVQIKSDTGAPDRVVSAVKEAARQAGLIATMTYEFYQLKDKPEPVHTVAPKYPETAQKQGLSGKVFLKFLVKEDGSVSDVEVLGGQEVFHQVAIDAIRQFRFKPVQHEGEPIAVWMTQPMMFQLDTRSEEVDVEMGQSRELPVAPPAAFKLHANFPNPFNPETTIAYELAEATTVTLDIYAVTGQVIRTLVSGPQAAGRYQVRWDATDAAGRSVASGTYYYRLTTDQFSDVKQMLLLK